ncbi:hypothetical protein [Streptosporangium sp. NPDC051022]|uniref:hypothetical protein n=1 Tax=Streptosporangium sp. NPDC051022 TaxID=3155752 RepID=UPI00342C6218
MTRKDRIPTGVQMALFSLSKNCYAPNCPKPVLQVIDDVPVVTAEMAHICGEKPGSARYDPLMTPTERASIQNIMLLCIAHHKLIDREPTASRYTVEILRSWKAEREGEYAPELNGIGVVTESRLQELIINSFTKTRGDLLSIVDELKSSNSVMVETLKSMILESFDRRYASDEAQLLYDAAMRLSHLHDHAPMIYEAALKLGHLHDHTPMIYEAALKLGHLHDHIWPLSKAAENLSNLDRTSERLLEATRRIQWETLDSFIDRSHEVSRVGDYSPNTLYGEPGFKEAISRIEEAAESLHMMEENRSVMWPPSPAYWTWLKRGVYIGVGFSIALAIFISLIVTKTSP